MRYFRGRYAARRSLYDAKEAARKEAYSACGAEAANQRLDEAYEERDRLEEKIKTYRPLTVAGAFAKMRAYGNKHTELTDDPDWYGEYFLSALSDLERLVLNGEA